MISKSFHHQLRNSERQALVGKFLKYLHFYMLHLPLSESINSFIWTKKIVCKDICICIHTYKNAIGTADKFSGTCN